MRPMVWMPITLAAVKTAVVHRTPGTAGFDRTEAKPSSPYRYTGRSSVASPKASRTTSIMGTT